MKEVAKIYCQMNMQLEMSMGDIQFNCICGDIAGDIDLNLTAVFEHALKWNMI